MVESTAQKSEDYNKPEYNQFKERCTQILATIEGEKQKEDASFKFDQAQRDFYLEGEQLLRFLRARDFKVDASAKMHDAWVRWRLSYKADQIRPSQIRDMLLLETFVLGPINKDGCISLFIRPRFHTPGTFHIDELVRYGIFCVEMAVKQIEAQNLTP